MIVRYRNHAYRLLWSGRTRHGMRAHLEFLSGGRRFWADAHEVSTPTVAAQTRREFTMDAPQHHSFTRPDGTRGCFLEY